MIGPNIRCAEPLCRVTAVHHRCSTIQCQNARF